MPRLICFSQTWSSWTSAKDFFTGASRCDRPVGFEKGNKDYCFHGEKNTRNKPNCH